MVNMKKQLIRLRSTLLVLLTHQVALPLLRIVRRPAVFPYTRNELALLPAGTLGHDLYLFLEQRQLPLLTHYARHDLKHILLGYDTTDVGEASLQSFMLGNGRVSFPVLATVLYSLFCMPEHWGAMRKAFRAGRQRIPIHRWDWYSLLHEPTADLREKLLPGTTIKDELKPLV